jgi:hypothetical protein
LIKKKSFIFKFTAKPFQEKSSAHIHKSPSKTKSSKDNVNPSYEQTIELTKDDLDEYYKYGKL